MSDFDSKMEAICQLMAKMSYAYAEKDSLKLFLNELEKGNYNNASRVLRPYQELLRFRRQAAIDAGLQPAVIENNLPMSSGLYLLSPEVMTEDLYRHAQSHNLAIIGMSFNSVTQQVFLNGVSSVAADCDKCPSISTYEYLVNAELLGELLWEQHAADLKANEKRIATTKTLLTASNSHEKILQMLATELASW